MQINCINKNNPNFKARVEVKLDKDYICYIRTLAPVNSAYCADGIIESVKALKEIAPKIGTDKDVITLTNDNFIRDGYLEIKYNDAQGLCIPPFEDARIGVVNFIKNLTGGAVDLFEKLLPENINYTFSPIKYSSSAVTKEGYKIIPTPVVGGRATAHLPQFFTPERIEVNDLISEVEKLNTAG